MNNKGFAISTMLYGLIIIISLVMMSIISIMAFNRSNNKKYTEDVRQTLENTKTITSSNIKKDDYIRMTPSSNSYTIEARFTGHYEDQSIDPSELVLWRVIAINNEGIDAVSEYTSSKDIYFRGTNGYMYYVYVLQEIAKQYSNAKYTNSTRMIGYDSQTETISDPSAFDGTLNKAPSQSSTPYISSGTGEEYLKGIAGDNKYINDYQLVVNTYKSDPAYGSTGLKTYKNGTSKASKYWLASRRYFYTSATDFNFSGRKIDSVGTMDNSCFRKYDLDDSGWDDESQNSALRPIITLKTNIIPIDGTGTKEDPYILP